MKTSGAPPSHNDDILLVNAYLDGELDAAAALTIEHRMAGDPELKLEYDRLAALRKVIAGNLGKDIPSDVLRRKIAAIAELPTKTEIPDLASHRFDWRQMAAAVVLFSCLASGATFLATRSGSPRDTFAAIVAGHQRSLLAATPFDVASSDRHTVKPWFDTKLAISPPVPDLAALGFPLAGGRVDMIGGQAVPTLVYRHQQHLISLVAVPKSGTSNDGAPPAREASNGYAVLTWRGRDFTYSAVSDVAEDTLAEFVSRWRAETESN